MKPVADVATDDNGARKSILQQLGPAIRNSSRSSSHTPDALARTRIGVPPREMLNSACVMTPGALSLGGVVGPASRP
jgi:hypothetical protein